MLSNGPEIDLSCVSPQPWFVSVGQVGSHMLLLFAISALLAAAFVPSSTAAQPGEMKIKDTDLQDNAR